MSSSQQILDTALRLFVENGFHGTPTSRVAAEAGVSNGSLFNAYKTKDHLVLAVYAKVKNDLDAHLSRTVPENQALPERLRLLFAESVRWAVANPVAFRYIQQLHASPYSGNVPASEIAQQTQRHLVTLAEGVASGQLRPLPVELLFLMVSGQVFALFQYLLLHPVPVKRQNALVEQGALAVWDSIRA